MGKHENHKQCALHPNWIKNKQEQIGKAKLKKEIKISSYLLKPNKCNFCSEILLYEKRLNKYCSNSCCASATNSKKKGLKKNKINITLANIEKGRKKTLVLKNKYLSNPKKCLVCDTIILFEKRCNNTCNQKSCLSKLYSERAKKNKLGGNHNRYSKWYESPIAGKVYLESSYEITIAKILDEFKINWSRPKPFKWIDDKNSKHLYYPDFLLNDYNIYLDPKNNYLIERDNDKISKVIIQNNIKLFILKKEQLNINYIKELIEK